MRDSDHAHMPAPVSPMGANPSFQLGKAFQPIDARAMIKDSRRQPTMPPDRGVHSERGFFCQTPPPTAWSPNRLLRNSQHPAAPPRMTASPVTLEKTPRELRPTVPREPPPRPAGPLTLARAAPPRTVGVAGGAALGVARPQLPQAPWAPAAGSFNSFRAISQQAELLQVATGVPRS